MKYLLVRMVGMGLLSATLAAACAGPPAPSEAVGVAAQAMVTEIKAGLGDEWHQEVAVGHDTIALSNLGAVSFWDRNGNPRNAVLPNGDFVGGLIGSQALFAPFFDAQNPLFLNNKLPIQNDPSPERPTWSTCDATQNAPDYPSQQCAYVDGVCVPKDGCGCYWQSSCITNGVYDTHTTYDPVHRRFIIVGHVRNTSWTTAAHVPGDPGPQADAFAWRYLLVAVSQSEDPADGFSLFSTPEYFTDWPRVGVSGDYFVVSYHGESSDVDWKKPLITLYLMDDLAAGVPNPRTFTYTQSQLSSALPYKKSDFSAGGVGFLVVPTHDEPPDASGTLWGTAYVMSRSSSEHEVPTLFGFVPGSDRSVAPTVISTPMPGSGHEGAGIQSYAGKDPTSASIRGGYLYSVYTHGDTWHLDQQRIWTSFIAPFLQLIWLDPHWGFDAGVPAGARATAPLVEVTADGSAVVGYTLVNPATSTTEVHSSTVRYDGATVDQVWATGPYTGGATSFPIDDRSVNRASIDPLNPGTVWILGLVGAGGSQASSLAEAVHVSAAACSPQGLTQPFPGEVRGCTGRVTFAARESLCNPGFTVCTAQQWAALPSAHTGDFTPVADYWTNDALGLTPHGKSGDCSADSSGPHAGNCGSAPMRVCTPDGSDALGNKCALTGCGLDATSPDANFGGCAHDDTAGALCCPVGLGCANGLPDDVFSTAKNIDGTLYSETRMVGCGGAVRWDERASLCGLGYSPCKASQWAAVTGSPRPSNNYWTDDILGLLGTDGDCTAESSPVPGSSCGSVYDPQTHKEVPNPARVCTSIGTDAYGNTCTVTGCDLDGDLNQTFGGCTDNLTAGTLCCAD